MAIDLNHLSAKELKSLAIQIKKQQTALSKRKPIAAVRKKLIALAKAAGYTITELFGSAKSAAAKTGKPAAKKSAKKAAKKIAKKAAKKTAKKTLKKASKKAAKKVAKKGRAGAKVAPKYRNPADPKVTWTGRGRQPLWFADLVKKGKKAEELLIK
jgi:DNA-binding protein H-NS